jgi:hypothetical protein
MKLKYLMEEFLTYGKALDLEIEKNLFSVYKNPSEQDYLEIEKEMRKHFSKGSYEENFLSKNFRFIIDVENKVVYAAPAYCIHGDIVRSLKKSNIKLSYDTIEGYGKIKEPYFVLLPSKIPSWAKKYLGQK